MKLTFLGTRGEIEARTRRHGMHTALLITRGKKHVMVDCGRDWLGRFEALRPTAIILTHAHPDHAWGLRNGSPVPVYATEQTWQSQELAAVQDRRIVHPREPFEIAGITFEAFPLEHSLRCPAVGYRINDGNRCAFYAPDVAYIHDRSKALENIDLYIGDGATVTRSMIRRQGDKIFGHAPIRTQLTWCEKEHVPRAIFTHCGTEIVEGNEPAIEASIREMAAAKGLETSLAYDGLHIDSAKLKTPVTKTR